MSRPRPLCHWPLATLATALLACSSPHDTGTDLGSDSGDLGEVLPKDGPCAVLIEPDATATCPVTVRYTPLRSPRSVAELSARMHVPIGVVRVVAADLVSEGMLESFQPSANVADDVLLITRLIAGVRSL